MRTGRYDVDPEGCARVLGEVEDPPERRDALTILLSGLTESQAATSGGTGAVSRALERFRLETVAPQSEAAEAGIAGAVAGVREAVHIFFAADGQMAETAGAGLGTLPAAGPRPSRDGGAFNVR